jgi:tetratricopeptide (TPR) repeat protein
MNFRSKFSRLSNWKLTAAFAVFLCSSPISIADQNDPRLNELFKQLHIVESQEAGNEITDQIWEIWRESSDDEINKLMLAGLSAMTTGRLRRAERIFDEIVYKAPEFAEGWNKRATIYYFLQEYQKSAADVRQTLLLEPRHFGATAGLGLIFLSLDYYESALGAFQQALDINPHLTGPKQQIKRLEEYLNDDPA